MNRGGSNGGNSGGGNLARTGTGMMPSKPQPTYGTWRGAGAAPARGTSPSPATSTRAGPAPKPTGAAWMRPPPQLAPPRGGAQQQPGNLQRSMTAIASAPAPGGLQRSMTVVEVERREAHDARAAQRVSGGAAQEAGWL
jgi:hypothetical protein